MAQFNHIFLNDWAESSPFTSNRQMGGEPRIPARNRASHSQQLITKLNTIWEQVQERVAERTAVSLTSKDGIYLEFKSAAGHDLITKSLEDIRQGVRLLNIRKVGEGDNQETLATVYIPSGKEQFFLRKVQAYSNEIDNRSGEPKNKKLIESIEDVKIAFLESLWTDPINLIPQNNAKWCEAWLRISSYDEATIIANFLTILDELQIQHKPNYVSFPERSVVLIYATRQQLSELLERNGYLAEYRIGQETARFWVNESNREQLGWVEDLLARLQLNLGNVNVCVLDTGVNNAHQLLAPILADNVRLSVNPAWGIDDHNSGSGHGTLMSGIAAYGNLEESLLSGQNILITHKLCSVKILPPDHIAPTPIEHWGEVTYQGISRAEIQLPDEKIIYCMAITSKTDVDRGRPSSWSGAIDNIAYGTENDKRLLIVSAGNIIDPNEWNNYPQSNLTISVQNPAQAWNILTVGAYTNKAVITDPSFSGYTTLAAPGELSPYSSTSLTWERTKWPVKPDVVFEGGNILRAPDGQLIDGHDDLGLLSTAKNTTIRQFDIISATSAATAQASWMAAKITTQYPNAWPETVRALIIHSAEWTDEMIRQFNIDITRKGHIKQLLRICGYGIPNLTKALYTTESGLTFVGQEYLQPFIKRESRYVTNEMHFYKLPWPTETLLEMGETLVKLKITLSYFIEPGPGEIGWKDKYRYQSFGLRFDLNSETESEDEFKRRINAAAREEDEEIESESGSERWLIGTKGRSLGSIHSDIWEGTAAQVASCNLLGIYPVMGWWRQRTNLGKYNNRARYSVIVSLETPAENIDLYTPVITQIQTPVTIRIQ